MTKVIPFTLIILVLFSCLIFSACGNSNNNDRVAFMQITTNVNCDATEYKGLREGEEYFWGIARFEGTDPSYVYNIGKDRFVEGNTYYLMFFDSNVTSIKINYAEKIDESKIFTVEQIEALYYDTNNPDHFYSDLFNKSHYTGNILDQEERFMPVEMGDHETVRILPFVYTQNMFIIVS